MISLSTLHLGSTIEGKRFSIHNDLDAIKWILAHSENTFLRAQTKVFRAAIYFKVEHSALTIHQFTNAPSRLSTTGTNTFQIENNHLLLPIDFFSNTDLLINHNSRINVCTTTSINTALFHKIHNLPILVKILQRQTHHASCRMRAPQIGGFYKTFGVNLKGLLIQGFAVTNEFISLHPFSISSPF